MKRCPATCENSRRTAAMAENENSKSCRKKKEHRPEEKMKEMTPATLSKRRRNERK